MNASTNPEFWKLSSRFAPDLGAPEWRLISSVIDAILSRLDGLDRDILLLCYFQSLSPEDIAKELDLNSSKVQLHINCALDTACVLLSKRKISITRSVLAGLLTLHGVKIAPSEVSSCIVAAVIPERRDEPQKA